MSKTAESMSAEELLADLAEPANRSTSMKQLAECLMVEWSGPPGLARDLRAAFVANKTGSLNQIRVLNDIVKVVSSVDSDGSEASDDDIEDLEAEHRRLIESYREDQ